MAARLSPAECANPKLGELTLSHSKAWPNSCHTTPLEAAIPMGWPACNSAKLKPPEPLPAALPGALAFTTLPRPR